MTGQKGKSGGSRDGAGRPHSKLTIRIGDQFYVPMRGVAEVIEIGVNQFTMKLGDERIAFMARSRSRRKPANNGLHATAPVAKVTTDKARGA
jgi:hypothetical protein